MVKRFCFPVLFLGCVAISSCSKEKITPSGNVVTREYSFSGYDELDISNTFTAIVTYSDTEEKVEIEADDNVHAAISVRMRDSELSIGISDGYSIKGSPTLKAYITTRGAITDFEASGSSNIHLSNGSKASDIDISLSGASYFRGEISIDNLEADISGYSRIDVSGSVNYFSCSASGASEFENYDFEVGSLEVELSGASKGYVTVHTSIDIEASGGSELHYKGDGQVVFSNLSGGSKIIKED